MDIDEDHARPAWSLSGAPSSFSLLSDKQLTNEVEFASWCPTMDILALVTLDNQLSLYRLDLQRVWMVCPETKVTSLSWRPDGKQLLTGHQNGSITHFCVEKGVIKYKMSGTLSPHSGSAVVHLTWVEVEEGGQSLSNHNTAKDKWCRHVRLFSRPPSASNPNTQTCAKEVTQGKKTIVVPWPELPSQLLILVSCDVKGVIALSAHGHLLVARLDVWQLCPTLPGAITQMQAYLTPDLGGLVVVVHTSSTPDQPCLAHLGAGSVEALVFKNPVLSSCERNLLHTSILCGHLKEVLDGAQQGMVAACKSWSSAQDDLRKKMSQLAQLLRDHDQIETAPGPEDWMEDDELVEAQLLCLLATGMASPGMHAFLTGTMGEHGIRRLVKTMEQAVQTVHELLQDQVLPSLHVATFILVELKSLALANQLDPTKAPGAASVHVKPKKEVFVPMVQLPDPKSYILDDKNPKASRERLAAEVQETNCTAWIGMCYEVACLAELAGSKAMLQVEALKRAVTEAGKEYEHFLAWLLRMWQQLEGVGNNEEREGSSAKTPRAETDEVKILDFISGPLVRDAIASDLKEPSLYPEEGSVASLLFPHTSNLEESKKMMEDLYNPLIPASLACRLRPSALLPPSTSDEEDMRKSAAPLPSQSLHVRSTWPSQSLRVQVNQLMGLCMELMDGVHQHLSSQFKLQRQVLLLDSLDPDLEVASCLTMHTATSQNCSDTVLLCIMVPGSSSSSSMGEASRLHAPIPTVIGGLERDSILLLDFAGEVWGDGTLKGSIHCMPEGISILDLSYYSENKLAVLIAESATRRTCSNDDGTSSMCLSGNLQDMMTLRTGLATMSLGGVALYPMDSASSLSALKALAFSPSAHMSSDFITLSKARACLQAQGQFKAPLSLSASRGVAAVFTTGMRVLSLDMEEDEEDLS
ncbi:hypothetical protein CEUSTIGMA_g11134.t1 [Chlamydomonas eustigma]|uniref:Anaphase-promoting complex subunit 4 n=1 Tax=Chlamydomonas eustigma TaxID=1157962 RepID=A0A250XLA8_9CHLO|nr:hypothetical protein CEUSTIGMA_g11134.t1 [Chlamydomonas eustigma]|eukprot:GAX83709.1 hypothetical protein CEUSTIGMA_g11134.t1 [Chlamydomonas eustigma]